jgi:hypothetical protein
MALPQAQATLSRVACAFLASESLDHVIAVSAEDLVLPSGD